ncbi:hypothetical protein F0460_13680 [Paenimyroides baculatum]|uniref:DUF3311 domain-containing protein n=1 Tax=Paenimyroides baculatum TaxID=2608000 RepID=A0A5M6CA72_9FLAO|nr:hypothetical protein F0460_13680 [Paenimyroides baculatum]
MKKRHKQKFLLISLFLLMVLNVPMIFMFNHKAAVLGIPVFYLAIFAIWLLVIVWSYYTLKKYYE